MNLASVLDRISQRGRELDLSETAISQRAGSKDLIRNWRRAVEKNLTLNVKHSSLVAVADVLQVSLEWLLDGDQGAVANTLLTGFAEQAVPFSFPDAPINPDAAQPLLSAIFRHTSSPATYRIAADLPAFMLADGDVIVVDMSRLPMPGELALVRLIDEQTGESQTRIARYAPPFLLAGTHALREELARVDQPGVTIRFPVIGCMRGLAP